MACRHPPHHHAAATYPTGKIGIAVYPANACSDTCYRSLTVLGALVGPAVNCSGDIVTYNLPTRTVSNWSAMRVARSCPDKRPCRHCAMEYR
ncbi:MAG: hypothetical protein U0176_14805 [Bacteroidia bacterium]